MKPEKMPAAFDPPPTHATTASGRRPSCAALAAGLAADDRLEIAHNRREGVRPGRRAETIVRDGNRGHPVAHRLVDGILEGPLAGVDADDPRPQGLHAVDVEALAPDVLGAHEDVALQTQERRRRGGGHAVLAGPGLGDEAFLAHAHGQEALPQRIVDLVRAGVGQVFALQIDAGAAPRLGQTPGQVQPRGPAGVLAHQVVQFLLELRVVAGLAVGLGQLLEGRHQRLGHVPTAVRPETAGQRFCLSHAFFLVQSREESLSEGGRKSQGESEPSESEPRP